MPFAHRSISGEMLTATFTSNVTPRPSTGSLRSVSRAESGSGHNIDAVHTVDTGCISGAAPPSETDNSSALRPLNGRQRPLIQCSAASRANCFAAGVRTPARCTRATARDTLGRGSTTTQPRVAAVSASGLGRSPAPAPATMRGRSASRCAASTTTVAFTADFFRASSSNLLVELPGGVATRGCDASSPNRIGLVAALPGGRTTRNSWLGRSTVTSPSASRCSTRPTSDSPERTKWSSSAVSAGSESRIETPGYAARKAPTSGAKGATARVGRQARSRRPAPRPATCSTAWRPTSRSWRA